MIRKFIYERFGYTGQRLAEEHGVIEKAWIDFGPKGAAAAVIAAVAIGANAGIGAALIAVCLSMAAVALWCLIMAMLIWDRPQGYNAVEKHDEPSRKQ